jgi:long-chain acyl-CoA synthetase
MFGQQPDLQQQRGAELAAVPPKGQPYSVPIPGSQVEGKSAVYRHWRFADQPLLETLDPAITTAHEAFEATGMCDRAMSHPRRR